MTSESFTKFVHQFDQKMRIQGRKVLLLLDNFSGHQWNKSKVTNVQVEFFTANLTAHVQPMDAGIIRTLKAYYKRSILERSLEREEAEMDDIFAVNQLEAMRLLETATVHVRIHYPFIFSYL